MSEKTTAANEHSPTESVYVACADTYVASMNQALAFKLSRVTLHIPLLVVVLQVSSVLNERMCSVEVSIHIRKT